MSGGSLSYHLRPNKAVERNLFVNILRIISRYKNISDYHYYGLGGPFMEEFKLLHAELRISAMTCIEENDEVAKRQKFNSPISGVDFYNGTISSFIPTFFPSGPAIVWLDYTSPKQLVQQFTEFATVLRRLSPGDVFKITLNANPDTLGLQDGSSPEDCWKKRLTKFRARAGVYAPADLDASSMRMSLYPQVLVRCIRSAVEKAKLPKHMVALPLASFSYSDGQQMLTLTGIVLNKTEVGDFLAKTRFASWPHQNLDWDSSPKPISVPELSMRERLRLESLLPAASGKELVDLLGFEIGDAALTSQKLMDAFVNYYRLLPHYSRVAT